MRMVCHPDQDTLQPQGGFSMNWSDALFSLSDMQVRLVCCRLLGRSGMSDEEFVKMCEKYLKEEEE
jgi:hypothetical protein